MFNDVDDTLRAVLIADVPIKNGEVEIAFDRPTREWAGKLSKPALNLFLYDIREREELKDDAPIITRDENGRSVKQRPPRRLDLAYLVTAWTREPADEHRILARVLASMYRQPEIAPEYLQGDLKAVTYPVMTRLTPPDKPYEPADLWGVLDNELRAALCWVVTVPLDVFRPVTGPLVREATLAFTARGEEWREEIRRVGGLVHAKGDLTAGLAGVKLAVTGTGFETHTDMQGRYSFLNLPDGEYTVQIEPPEGKPKKRPLVVPAESYDIEL